MDILQILLALILVLILKYLYFSNTRSKKLLNTVPGPHRFPILGDLLQLINLPRHKFTATIEELADKYRSSGCFVISFTELYPLAYLTTGETVAKLLLNSTHLAKGDGYRMIKEYFGDGLILSRPKKWTQHRALINPAFSFKTFDNFIRVFNQQSVILCELLHSKFDKGESSNDGFIDISHYFTRFSLDSILELCFGLKLEAQSNPVSEIHEATELVVTHIGTRFISPWLRGYWVWRYLTFSSRKAEIQKVDKGLKSLKKILLETIKSRQQQSVTAFHSDEPKTFIDILLENDTSNTLSTEEVIEEAITITFAGHDTVATAINFVMFMLALHPGHQSGIQEELDNIFATESSSNGCISLSHLSAMKYLERFIKETLRLFPSVSGLTRKLESDLDLGNGIILPAGINVSVLISALHKDPKVFPNPEEFDPDRFLPENAAGRHPCAYIPFSKGPRNCIGQKFAMLETKLVVASLLREFSVETRDTVSDLKMIPSITLILVDSIKMKLVPRRSS